MRGMVDYKTGVASPRFDDLVRRTAEGFLRTYKQAGDQACGFIVPSVMLRDGGSSHWGILDLKTMADEDVYIELWRRFHAALFELGEERVAALGLVDVHIVLNRAPEPTIIQIKIG